MPLLFLKIFFLYNLNRNITYNRFKSYKDLKFTVIYLYYIFM